MDQFVNEGLTFEVTDVPPAVGTHNGQAVILLHGFPADRRSWDAVIPVVTAAGYRVLAPDQRGYSPGARPAARRAYALPRLAADIIALADAAGHDRFHLVGHDWGASLAWYLAAQHPNRLTSLTTLSVPHPQAWATAMTRSDQAIRSWYMAAYQMPALPEWLLSRHTGHRMRAMLTKSGLSIAHARRYASRAIEPGALTGALNWYRALPYAARERINRIQTPTLFMWSDGDRYITRAAAALCEAYVTGPFQFEEIAGASHWLPEELPRRVADLLVRHLNDWT